MYNLVKREQKSNKRKQKQKTLFFVVNNLDFNCCERGILSTSRAKANSCFFVIEFS